ncbi:neurotensin receptor type 1-like [Chanos chanos]|uniref:Neurotensin receptor type 1-like n=1 Tax=Chanos chanos TaxID=29144 RepID=A0A6J2WAX9_CHACN|nr:neurotensin receptor type 1-like [Chanos chanos]
MPKEIYVDFSFFEQIILSDENQTRTHVLNSSVMENNLDVNTDIYSKLIVTVIYVVLFAVGFLGNSLTLYISFKRKSVKHLQGTVHYHLVSLAISDLLILILCMPVELYSFIWIHHPWAFGEVACRGYYFVRDGCSYATSLNIASLSVERFMALCHPFKAKSIMSRGRTRKLISALWIISLFFALPMLATMGQIHLGGERICTTIVSQSTAKTVLQVNALLSFVMPMMVISVMNGLISQQLQELSKQTLVPHYYLSASRSGMDKTRVRSLRHGVNVLRVVVLAFVVCWLPYHSRRLMYCYVTDWSVELYDFYHYFYMVTNVLFYVSSAINPILYNLVSSHYRKIFFSTLGHFHCCRQRGGNRIRRSSHQQLQQMPSSMVFHRSSRQTLCSTIAMEAM